MRQLQDLTLHVGLPKTGTTTLQREVFPEFRGYVCGTESSGRSGDLAQQMLRLYQVKGAHRDWNTDVWRSEAIAWWAQARATSDGPLLVSLEGLFRWFDPVTGMPWPLMGDGDARWSNREAPHPLIGFLLALQMCLPTCRIRVVLTLRNQSDFMASHYAQISYRVLAPSQGDFEEKVRQATRREDPFFNWFATAKGLSDVVGIENFRIAVFEEGLDQACSVITRFVDDSWRPVPVVARHNVREGPTGWSATSDRRSRLRSLTRDTWPIESFPRIRKLATVVGGPALRLVGGKSGSMRAPIIVSEELREEICNTYQASNRLMAEMCDRDLMSLGY